MRMMKMITSIALVAMLAMLGNQWVGAARVTAPTNDVTALAVAAPPAISLLLPNDVDESDLQPVINLLLAEDDDEPLARYRVYIPLVLKDYTW